MSLEKDVFKYKISCSPSTRMAHRGHVKVYLKVFLNIKTIPDLPDSRTVLTYRSQMYGLELSMSEPRSEIQVLNLLANLI